MGKFPKKPKERRPKPQPGNADPVTPKLGPQFLQANAGPVPHRHYDDLDGPSDPGLQALTEIFKYIKGKSADLIFKINKGLEEYYETGNTNKYDAAVQAFDAFVNKLNDKTASANGEFGPTIDNADIEPIKDHAGFSTSARVIVQWLGGTHSDSSVIHVP